MDAASSKYHLGFRPRALLWLMVPAAALLMAFLFSLNWHLMGEEEDWLQSFLVEAIYSITWSLFVPLIVNLTRRLSQRKLTLLAICAVLLVIGFAVTLLQRSVVVILWWYLIPSAFSPPPDSLLQALQTRFYRHIPLGLLYYAIISLGAYIFDFYRKYREQELKAAQLQALLANAELRALKMQLHPHFLFNTLNSIAGLMHENVAVADEMLARLGSFLRLTLESARAHFVALEEEIEFLRHYLAIEEIRFQDRLEVEWKIVPTTLRAQVPSLILQPLVENALKHGINAIPEAGQLVIVAQRSNEALILQVKDNGPGMSLEQHAHNNGIGIQNVRQRLKELYDDSANLNFENLDTGGLCVTLILPYSEAIAIA